MSKKKFASESKEDFRNSGKNKKSKLKPQKKQKYRTRVEDFNDEFDDSYNINDWV